MKKRMLSLLMVVVLLAGLLPTLAWAEETSCNHKDDNLDCSCELCGATVHNEAYVAFASEVLQHGSYCQRCQVYYDMADHVDEDQNGTCDVCDMCVHNNVDITRNANAHTITCSDCSRVVASGAHTLLEGMCTVCGYDPAVYGSCTHLDADGNCVCDECRNTIHVMDQGKCLNCGHVCPHQNQKTEAWGFTHTINCLDCDMRIADNERHTMLDNKCTVCGHVCNHENTYRNDSNGSHYVGCTACGAVFVEFGLHTMENGKCTVCGACELHTPTVENPHICSVCSFETPCVTRDEDCKCDICGKEMHNETKTVLNETQHTAVCVRCGIVVFEQDHYDNDGKPGCDWCGYGCLHENQTTITDSKNHAIKCTDCGSYILDLEEHSWEGNTCTVCNFTCAHENVENYMDLTEHAIWCMDCGNDVVEQGAHTMENGKCTVCGACETHSYPEEDPHQCAVCGVRTVCIDRDIDCACDTCGALLHLFAMEWDENQHRGQCIECGEYTEWEAHSYGDESGICIFCCYGCEHTLGEWYLTTHYGHYNVCSNCFVYYNDFQTHTDADGNGECDVCGYAPVHAVKKVEEVPATCQNEGVKAHYSCERCWAFDEVIFSDAEGKNAVKMEDLIIPKTAHNYQDGICTVCGEKDALYVKVEVAPDVPAVKTEIPAQELLTEEDKTALEQGSKVEIALSVENANKTVSPETKNQVEDAVAQINANNQPAEDGASAPETQVGMYLDINLTKTVDEQVTSITETDSKIPITVDVPEDLQNTDENVDRAFSVLRVHEGQVDELKDLDNDPNTVTFETDRFSIYVLVYTDTVTQEPTEDPSEETTEETTEAPSEETTEEPSEESTKETTESSKPAGDDDASDTGDTFDLLTCVSMMLVSLLGMALLMFDNRKIIR